MNEKLQLQLQAYLDGELSSGEANRVAALIESDAPTRALYTELQETAAILKGNEPVHRLAESREFYWSKIEREIERPQANPPQTGVAWWLEFLRRHAAAVSGLGVATVLLIVGAFQLHWVSPNLLEEIDNPLETSSLSFRSESQKMTVVWISDPFSNVKSADDESDPADETVQ